MQTNKYGVTLGVNATQKEPGMSCTTTATTKNATQIIALYARIKWAIVRFASWLAVVFRGVA